MTAQKERLTFHLITSRVFWVGAPMIISEIIKRGHYFSAFDELALPSSKILLDCDVFIDTSTITRRSFYLSLLREVARKKRARKKIPLMVDPPESVMNSFDKRETHDVFPDLIPESYNLTGQNNRQAIEKFNDDEYIVVKDPLGWWGKSVERVTPAQAIKRYGHSKGLVVQKYIPFEKGVGRIVTLNHKNDFEIACSYLRIPKSWRTGVDVEYECVQEPVSKELRDFAHTVSTRCGLYLNGIDYIYSNGKYVLLEINAVPAMKEPYDEFQIDIPRMLISHVERNVRVSK